MLRSSSEAIYFPTFAVDSQKERVVHGLHAHDQNEGLFRLLLSLKARDRFNRDYIPGIRISSSAIMTVPKFTCHS